jgi:hypothetical protein
MSCGGSYLELPINMSALRKSQTCRKWFSPVTPISSTGLTKPGEVGDFFALVSMKSPISVEKRSFSRPTSLE